MSSILEEKKNSFDNEQDPNDFAEHFFLKMKDSENFTVNSLIVFAVFPNINQYTTLRNYVKN